MHYSGMSIHDILKRLPPTIEWTKEERLARYAEAYDYWLKRSSEGGSYRVIARELGIRPHSKLYRWVKTYRKLLDRQSKVTPPDPAKLIYVQLADGRSFKTDDPLKIPSLIAALRRKRA